MAYRSPNPTHRSLAVPRTAPHSLMAKLFHWSFVVVLGYGLAKQVDEVEELEDWAFLVEEVVFATLFLLFLLVRFLYMRTTRPSALPPDTPELVCRVARICHLGMYAALAMLALTGLMIGALFASGIREGSLFGA